MNVTMTGRLIGTKKTDFEQHRFVSLYVMVGVKGGDGHMSERLRFKDGFDKYESIVKMIGSQVDLEGHFESNDKGEMVFVVANIKQVFESKQHKPTAVVNA